MRAVLCLPPARTSNEYDLVRAMPATDLTVVADGERAPGDRTVVLPVRRLPLLGGHEGWTAAVAWLRGLSSLDGRPADVVVSLEAFSFGTAQAARLARRLRAPHAVLVFETLTTMPLYRVPPWRPILRRTLRRADCFVGFSQKAVDHLVAMGAPAERCAVVHPGVDTDRFRPAPVLEPGPEVLFVGMLRANWGADKGVHDLVAAAERLAPEVDGFRLTMVGDGHLRPALEARAATAPWLRVAGRRPRAEIPDVLRAGRVLVLPSKTTPKWEEQFGFVLVEAMACGLPVVATRSGVIPEVVPPWNPLVPEGDPAALAEGIRAALGPDGEAWGRRNREHVLERFDLTQQAKHLRDVLGDLVAGR
ncbi:MAG TPA: glycosyltransferase [Acidimicrobiales bacterium]|jgi:glycosyltransferase involved in cell wall biosynthesis